jgi:hypothetical protein
MMFARADGGTNIKELKTRRVVAGSSSYDKNSTSCDKSSIKFWREIFSEGL